MTFDDWCATDGAYLNDNDLAARAARLMARRAWDAAVAAERERCAKQVEDTQRQFPESGLDGWLLAAKIRAA
jgi:hypothetical protein